MEQHYRVEMSEDGVCTYSVAGFKPADQTFRDIFPEAEAFSEDLCTGYFIEEKTSVAMLTEFPERKNITVGSDGSVEEAEPSDDGAYVMCVVSVASTRMDAARQMAEKVMKRFHMKEVDYALADKNYELPGILLEYYRRLLPVLVDVDGASTSDAKLTDADL